MGAGAAGLGAWLALGVSRANDVPEGGPERSLTPNPPGGKTSLRLAVPALHSTPAFPLWCADRLGLFARQGLALQVQDGRIAHPTVSTGLRGDVDGTPWVAVQGVASGALVLRGSAGALREGTPVRPAAGAPSGAAAPATLSPAASPPPAPNALGASAVQPAA